MGGSKGKPSAAAAGSGAVSTDDGHLPLNILAGVSHCSDRHTWGTKGAELLARTPRTSRPGFLQLCATAYSQQP